MDFRALREIEKRYDIRLPKEYTSFILNYPSLEDENEQQYLEETISRCLDVILSHNDFFRDDTDSPRHSVAFREFGWQDSYFVIGSDGCGNYYFLDTSRNPAPVFFVAHGEEKIEPLAKDISGLLEHFLEVSAESKT